MVSLGSRQHPLPIVIDELTSALAERYTIEREIGRGGMATVYLAHDIDRDSMVALKVMRTDFAPLLASERFAREIRITAGLQHPNILTVLASGSAGGAPFYTMPFVDGESVSAWIARERQLPVLQTLGIGSELADALAYAHARGFVHRDIKPENILLSHGHAVLADFGIARAIDVAGGDRLTESGMAVGTARYMSPEQAAGGEVDGRSDIYAMGCVLYEMIVGSPPFVGPTPQSVMARHALDPVPRIRTVRDTVHPMVEAAITRALAKVPSDRFATANEFRAALIEASRAQESAWTPADTPVATMGAHTQTSARRSLSLAAVGIATAALAFFSWRALRAGPALDRNRITVFPLSVSAGFKGPAAIGEDVATVIGHSLDGIGPLRWVDGWRLLAATDRSADGRVDPARARLLARAQRSGYYITGRVIQRGDSVDVLIDLMDVASDSTAREGKGTSILSEAWRASAHAVNVVLPALVPNAAAHDRTTEWADRAPDAVANFLLGESAFRRARSKEALEHYRTAVRIDSTFSLAAVRGAQAATWEHKPEEAGALIRRALAHPLSPRFTQFAIGYAAYLEGRPDSASRAFHRALAIDPEMATAWMQLGETYRHLLPAAGRPDTLADAAFAEALRLDTTATQLLFHPIENRLRENRVTEGRRLLDRFLATNPDTMLAWQLRIMADCVERAPARMDWKGLVATHAAPLLQAAQALAVGGAQLPCASAAYRAIREFETPAMAAMNPAVDGRRWYALVGLSGVSIAGGTPRAAIAQIDSAIARNEGGASLYLLGAAAEPAFAARAAASAHQTIAGAGAACERCVPLRAWQLGSWAGTAHDTAVLRVVRDRIQREPTTPDPQKNAELETMTRSLAARGALARRDTTEAMRLLAETLAQAVSGEQGMLLWRDAAARGPERLLYAQLLAARREFTRAMDVADVFDSPAAQSYVAFAPASLQLRAAMADSAHDGARSAAYRRRLLALSRH